MLNRTELLNIFISTNDPDTYDTIKESLDVLDLYNMDYMTMYDLMLGYATDTPMDDLSHQMHCTLISTFKTLIRQHGVELNDECMLYELSDIAKALYEIMLVEDKAPLTEIMNMGISDNEKLAMLLGHISEMTPEKMLTLFSYVDESIINRIKSILAEQPNIETDEAEHVKTKEFTACLIAYRNLKAYFNNDTMWCDQFIVNPGSIARPADLYFKFYSQDVLPKLEVVDVEKVSRDLLGMACLSSDFYSTPMGFVRQYIGAITHDTVITSQVDARATKITGEMNNAQE